MIEILKPSKAKLEVLGKPTSQCWINVASPTEEEILRIKSLIDVPEEFLNSLKDIDEIPTIEERRDFTLITIRTPYNNPKIDLEYYTVPIGVLVTNDFVMTICYFENDVIEKLKSQRFSFRKTQLVFRLLLASAKLFLSYLKEIKRKIYLIESQLEQSQKNKQIMELLELEKDLVYFETSLKSNEILIERVEKTAKGNTIKKSILIKTLGDKELIENVIEENKQAIEMTTIYSNILSSTLDAFASVISNNLNIVIKVLTSITIVLMLPTLVASVYGMNVKLPFQQSPSAFLIIMAFSFTLSVFGLLVLWKKKLF